MPEEEYGNQNSSKGLLFVLAGFSGLVTHYIPIAVLILYGFYLVFHKEIQ